MFTTGDRNSADTNDNMKTIAPSAILRVSGMAAFRDDKLKGWLDGNAALGTVLLHNKIKEVPVIVKSPAGGYISFNVYKSQVHLEVQAKDPEHPVITIKITQQAALKESANVLNLTSPQVLEELSGRLTDETRKQIEAAVSAARELKSDYLGFGEAVERRNPRGWKKVRDHWEVVFAHCEVRIEADAVIRHTDMRSNSFQVNK